MHESLSVSFSEHISMRSLLIMFKFRICLEIYKPEVYSLRLLLGGVSWDIFAREGDTTSLKQMMECSILMGTKIEIFRF